jgi:hypothetical protein
MQAMKDWHKSHPNLFVKSPRNLPGSDNYSGSYLALPEFLVKSTRNFPEREPKFIMFAG